MSRASLVLWQLATKKVQLLLVIVLLALLLTIGASALLTFIHSAERNVSPRLGIGGGGPNVGSGPALQHDPIGDGPNVGSGPALRLQPTGGVL